MQTQARRQHARGLGDDESADQANRRGFGMSGLFFAAEDLQVMGRRPRKRVRVVQAKQRSMSACRSGQGGSSSVVDVRERRRDSRAGGLDQGATRNQRIFARHNVDEGEDEDWKVRNERDVLVFQCMGIAQMV